MKFVVVSGALAALSLQLGAGAAWAQDDPPVGPPAPAPKLVLSSGAWDFGTVKYGPVLEKTLTLRNEGNIDLQILGMLGSCACTIADITRTVIPPGESAVVTIRFDTTKRQGDIDVTIKIRSSDPQKELSVFNVSGVVKRLIDVRPESLTLSSVGRPAPMSKNVTIRFNTPEPLTPVLKTTTARAFSAKLEEISAGREYRLTVTTHKQVPFGRWRDMILIETGFADEPLIRVPVYVNIQLRVQAVPAAIYIPSGLAKKSYRQIRIQYFGARTDFRVTGVEASHEVMSVELKSMVARPVSRGRRRPAEAKLEQIIAVWLPPGSKMPDAAEIRIHTNDAEFGLITVPITDDAARFRELIKNAKAGGSVPSSQPAVGNKPGGSSGKSKVGSGDPPQAQDDPNRPTSS